MTQPIASEIVERGRGPQHSTSRVTVQDLVPYFQEGCSDVEIIRWIPTLTANEVRGQVEYLEATIRQRNTSACLPVFTIADVKNVNTSKTYAEQVVETLIDYLQQIETVRGAGRLYVP